jgi:hypothetical protein
MGKKSGYGSGIRIRDEQPGSLLSRAEKHFFGVTILTADPRWKNSDPGWKKFGSGINITDPLN